MRNDPVAYHVAVSSEAGVWRGTVQAFNKLDAAFRAGVKSTAEGVTVATHAVFYIHQDKGLGCCPARSTAGTRAHTRGDL